MKRHLPALTLVAVLTAVALPQVVAAQSSATSRRCDTFPVYECVELSGRVEFEPGETPPAEARVNVTLPNIDAFEQFTLRATAPDYRFSLRAPRGEGVEIRLSDLPAPWLDDQSAADTMRAGGVVIRSGIGIPVTATFRYPLGSVAPPPFKATVRRSVGDRQFVPVDVTNGQFTFLTRRGLPYTISAAPEGFGRVRAEFPAQTVAHDVVVNVDAAPRPVAQSLVLVEGPAIPGNSRDERLVPIVLAERSPTGGGELPYATSVTPVTGAVDALRLNPGSRANTGARQRLGLLPVTLRNDAVANGPRSALLRFAPLQPGLAVAPDLDLTVLDDESGTLPPLLTVAGAVVAPCCNGVATALYRAEGAPGEAWVITLELDRPAPAGGAEVTVDTVALLDELAPRFPRPFAVEGVDFQPMSQRVVFAPGSRTATVRIEGIGNDRIEMERYFYLAFTDPRALAPREPVIELRIVNDDVDGRPAARPDLLPVSPLPRANVLDVFANDVLPPALYPTGRLDITQAPQFGVATVDSRGTATVVDDRIVYTPMAGRGGQSDRLAYRACDALGEACVAARVVLPIRPVPATPTTFTAGSASGFRDLVFSGLPALPDARIELASRPFQAGEFSSGSVRRNPDARFAPMAFEELRLPALGTSDPAEVARSVLVHLQGSAGSDVDLYVSYDANNDGSLAESEQLCASASAGAVETCVVDFTQTRAGATRLHIALANPGPVDVGYRLVRGGVQGLGTLPAAAATGPTRLAEGEAFPVRLSWRDDETPLRSGLIGLLRIRNADGASLGDVPVVVDLPRVPDGLGQVAPIEPRVLRTGIAAELHVVNGAAMDSAFIDIPPGAGQMTVAVAPVENSSIPMTVSLRRAMLPTAGGSATPARAPAEDASSITRTSNGGLLDFVLSNPPAGRWYVVISRPDVGVPSVSRVNVTATLTTATPAPIIRPGGYFNPSRSGHGLFVYPAGNDWAGLWYTYSQDGAPVWYYLQGVKPGTDGIWTAPIYRSGWNGSRNHLTEVGRATITPTANDAFQFTYVLDGETGSEPFSSFGRGCPSIGGQVVDASGHWFDPSRAGAGYSVQLLPNYEFHAVFAYSARGVPRFLVAERNGVGAANETLPLQQLRGFCPLCVRGGDPTRSSVGVLRREFANGQLSRINVDAAFTNGTPGSWTVNDAVVPLGGLQGCAVD